MSKAELPFEDMDAFNDAPLKLIYEKLDQTKQEDLMKILKAIRELIEMLGEECEDDDSFNILEGVVAGEIEGTDDENSFWHNVPELCDDIKGMYKEYIDRRENIKNCLVQPEPIEDFSSIKNLSPMSLGLVKRAISKLKVGK